MLGSEQRRQRQGPHSLQSGKPLRDGCHYRFLPVHREGLSARYEEEGSAAERSSEREHGEQRVECDLW